MTLRREKLEELIRKLAADFIQRESSRISLITVTRAAVSEDEKYATVFVTVLPETSERAAIDFLKRNRREFQDYIKSHARTRSIPTIDFKIDIGEKTRQKIDELGNLH
jgi:ribosome-binding factor A